MLAIELLTAARGIGCARRCEPGRGDRRGVARSRDLPGPGPDRFLAPEIEAATEFVEERWRPPTPPNQ